MDPQENWLGEQSTKWLEEAKKTEIQTWLNDIHLPYDDPRLAVQYISNTKTQLFKKILTINDEMPQSYVHWWCYMRQARRQGFFSYPIYQKWLDVLNQWNETHEDIESKTTPSKLNYVSMFAMFTCWLDMLYLDLTLYDDEGQRPSIPRLYTNGIQWQVNEQKAKSRKETIEFIIQQSSAIFKERGWNEGLQYWLENTKKYKI